MVRDGGVERGQRQAGIFLARCAMSETWQVRKRPARLEGRVEFADYNATRDFLDRLAELSEREQSYPNLSFGRTYVNITLDSPEDEDEVSEATWRIARLIDELVAGTGG